MSVGLWTSTIVPFSISTSKPTLGIVVISSRSYSRSRRSRTMSMCSRPRKPQRKPKPSASEVSGSQESAASLSTSFSSASRRSGIVVGVDREEAAEDHRLDVLVARQRPRSQRSHFVVSVSPTRSIATSLTPVIR